MATLTRMYQRRGTAAQWADVATTVILQAGEIGLETDTGKFKIGNGVASWSALSYYLKDTDNAGLYAKLAPVGPSYSQNITGINVFTPQSASQTPIVVSGVSGQSAVLQRWRNSADATLASIDQTGKITAAGALFNAVVNVNNNKITNLATPTSDADAVNKAYVDDAIAGLAWKEAVHLIATTNVALTGNTSTLVIDGHSALDSADNGYRLLLTAQTTASQKGIYVYNDNGTTYTLSRATDADLPAELVGASVYVQEGTTYGTSSWVQSNHYMTSFDQQTWVQFSGAALITAGTGMTKTGNTLNVVGTANRITANADSIDIASTYVGQSTITTVGALTSGSLATGFTVVGTALGGTGIGGATPFVVGDILYASTTSALSRLASGSTAGYPLLAGGTGVAPAYGQIATGAIANSTSTTTGVTYNKLQYVSAQWRVLGRKTTAAGNVEEMEPNDLISMIGQGTTSISISRIPTGTTGLTVALGDHTHTIDQLSDVVITGTPQTREVIKFNGTNWVNEIPSGGISVGATPPSQPAAGDAWFDSTDGSLYVWYEDTIGNPNLITNPSFETNTTGWSAETNATISRNTSIFNEGVASLQIVSTAGNAGAVLTSNVTTNASTTYTASAWIKGTAGVIVKINLNEYTSAPTLVGTTTSQITLDGGWQQVVVTRTFGATGVRANIEISSTTASTIYVDTASITPTATSAQWVQVRSNSAVEASLLTRVSALESSATNDAFNVQAAKTAAYTLGNGDQNDLIQMNTATAVTLSVPTDATYNFPIGTKIEILQVGAGQVTVAAVTPGTTTVNGTPGLKLRAQWSHAVLIKRAANTWVLTGDLAA